MIAKIVVCYDGSPESALALRRAAEIAGAFESTIVMSIVEGVPVVPMGVPAMMEAPLVTTEPLDGERAVRLEEARDLMRRLGASYELAGPIVDPAVGVVDLAVEHDADLIVVGTNEPGLLERIFVGSVSDTVARTAGCDVLVVHHREDEMSAAAEIDPQG